MQNRATSSLSAKLERSLLAYASAAGAAGVGMLVLAQAAEAKIVYTATHQVIGRHGQYNLDLNNDRVIDVVIFQTNSCTEICWNTLGAMGNGSIESKLPYHSALALRKDRRINSKKRFRQGSSHEPVTMVEAVVSSSGSTFVAGPWVNVKNRYLGLKFQIHGKTHFGWARMSVQVDGSDITGTLTGYAYETVTSKGIVAGDKGASPVQHAGLARLALGAAGK